MEIYFDNAATTQPLPEVIEAMRPYELDAYGNPSSIYAIGRKTRKIIDEARDRVSESLGVKANEITFCSSATESICTSLIGAALKIEKSKHRFVTTTIEHKAVLKAAHWLEEHLGWDITLITPEPSGHVNPQKFVDACLNDCGLASLQLVNNEIGTIQPVEEIASRLKDTDVVFHSDIVQGIGKIALKVVDAGVDILSASAHKFYGPKSIGFTYIRDGKADIAPVIVGGSQELDRRAGTENAGLIIGLATALDIVVRGQPSLEEKLKEMEAKFIDELDKSAVEYELNGSLPRVPGLMSIFFTGVESESLLLHADRAQVYISAGSACSAGAVKPSYVITAIGHEKRRGLCSIRISLGRHNTMEDIEEGAKRIIKIISKLRGST